MWWGSLKSSSYLWSATLCLLARNHETWPLNCLILLQWSAIYWTHSVAKLFKLSHEHSHVFQGLYFSFPLLPFTIILKSWERFECPSSPETLSRKLAPDWVLIMTDYIYFLDRFQSSSLKNRFDWPPLLQTHELQKAHTKRKVHLSRQRVWWFNHYFLNCQKGHAFFTT